MVGWLPLANSLLEWISAWSRDHHVKSALKQSQSQASQKGELIHCDIVELEVRSTYGIYKYFITLIDDCSRYIVVFMLQHNSQAYESFMAYDAKLHHATWRLSLLLDPMGAAI